MKFALALIAVVAAEEAKKDDAAGDDTYTKIKAGGNCNSKKPKMGCVDGYRCGTVSGGGLGDMVKDVAKTVEKVAKTTGQTSDFTGEVCQEEAACGQEAMGIEVVCSATRLATAAIATVAMSSQL